MGRLDKAFEFGGGNHGHVSTRTTTHHDHFAVFDRTIHQRFELLSCLAVSGFYGHDVPFNLYRKIVQKHCTWTPWTRSLEYRCARGAQPKDILMLRTSGTQASYSFFMNSCTWLRFMAG